MKSITSSIKARQQAREEPGISILISVCGRYSSRHSEKSCNATNVKPIASEQSKRMGRRRRVSA